MKRKTYNRTCPKCKEVVKHLDKYTYLDGVKYDKLCRPCSARKNRPSLVGKSNPMYGRSVKDVWIEKYGQETADKMWSDQFRKLSKKTKGKINVGMKNGMKQLEARLKMSKTRTEIFKNGGGEELRKKYSEGTRRAWREGKMDGVNVGQSKWWDYETKSGRIVKCQGTWELKYVEYLDKNNIPFKAHRGTIPYTMNGNKHSYLPDFYLITEDRYVDVKNDYHYSISKDKFKAIRKCNPNIKLDILLKEDLNRLGIEV